jgi:hypothetical protein
MLLTTNINIRNIRKTAIIFLEKFLSLNDDSIVAKMIISIPYNVWG